jgi:hypothetical protein
MMLKNHEIEDTDQFVEPTKTYKPEEDYSSNGLFMYVPQIDQPAFFKYLNNLPEQTRCTT